MGDVVAKDESQDEAIRRIARWAAIALLVHSLMLCAGLVALFAQSAAPWSWRTLLSLMAVTFSLTTGALVWRAPTRSHVLAGLAVLLLGLLRVGPVESWGAATYAIVIVTAILIVPLARALWLVPRG
jgi:hypothetical protein